MRTIFIIILKFLAFWLKKNPKEKKDRQIYELEQKRDKKLLAMQNALDAGRITFYHQLNAEWLFICKKLDRLRARLEKNFQS